VAFEHTNAQHLHINTTSPWTYHYQWAHKHPLGPSYLGGFDKNSCYSGKQYSIKQVAYMKHLGLKLKYTPHQLALTRALGLKWAFETPTKPSNSLNWCEWTTSPELAYTNN